MVGTHSDINDEAQLVTFENTKTDENVQTGATKVILVLAIIMILTGIAAAVMYIRRKKLLKD